MHASHARALQVLPLLAIAVFLGGAVVTKAASIEGRVSAVENGRTLAYCSIRIEGSGLSRDSLAKADGSYAFSNLPAGTFRLRFSYLGYKIEERVVSLGPNQTLTLDVALSVQAIQLETIEVIGSRDQGEAGLQPSFVEIDAETLSRVPAFGEDDPIRALQLLPGVQAASDLSSGLYVRGGGPDQNLVLLDDVPIYNPTHAFGLFSTFNSDAIGDVTLYKGAYPARYGGRLGAVLDVRARESRGERTRAMLGISTVAARLYVDGQLSRLRWSLGARRTYLDPILSLLRRNDPQIPAYWFYDLNGALALQSGAGTTRLAFYLSRDDLGLDADASTQINFRWGNTAVALGHRRLFGENLVLNAGGWFSQYRSDSDLKVLETPIDFANRIRDFSGEANLIWALPPHHQIGVGASASSYDVAFEQRFNLEQNVDYGRRPFDVSAWLEDVWRPRAETSIRAGVRSRYMSEGERWRLEPRFSIRQELDRRWTLKAAGGLYHQVLQLVSTEGFSAGDFYVPIDQTAQPGRSVQAVVGMEWRPQQGWRVSIEGYRTWLSDLVAFDNDTPADGPTQTADDLFVTQGTGWAAGLELFLERRLGPVTGWIGYTLGWTRRSFPEVEGGREFPPKYDRRHDLSWVVQADRGPWQYSASFLYGTGQAFTPAAARFNVRDPSTGNFTEFGDVLPAARNSGRLLPYHRLDVSVARSFSLFGQRAKWLLQVFNLYSRRNDWFINYQVDDPSVEPEIFRQLPIIPSLGIEVEF